MTMTREKQEQKFTRQFLGNLHPRPNYVVAATHPELKNRDMNFEKAHLNAYLKGKRRFRFGYSVDGNPKWHIVMEGKKPINS